MATNPWEIFNSIGDFPDPTDICAELRYKIDGVMWGAIVTSAEDNEVGFRLWFQRGKRYSKSGTFESGKALKQYIMDVAKEKFGDIVPIRNTLSRLMMGPGTGVIRDCYKQGLYSEKEDRCRRCAFGVDCKDGIAKVVMPEVVKEPEEPEDLFLQRLRGKVHDKWGEK